MFFFQARSFVKGLLRSNMTKRLGGDSGVASLMSHPWMSTVDFRYHCFVQIYKCGMAFLTSLVLLVVCRTNSTHHPLSPGAALATFTPTSSVLPTHFPYLMLTSAILLGLTIDTSEHYFFLFFCIIIIFFFFWFITSCIRTIERVRLPQLFRSCRSSWKPCRAGSPQTCRSEEKN